MSVTSVTVVATNKPSTFYHLKAGELLSKVGEFFIKVGTGARPAGPGTEVLELVSSDVAVLQHDILRAQTHPLALFSTTA